MFSLGALRPEGAFLSSREYQCRKSMMRSLTASLGGVLFLSLWFVAGCATQQPLVDRQNAALDSMYAENEELRERLGVVRDSLQFYDDIDSGQYYRDRRMLELEIDRLEYEVAVCSDGGEVIQTLRVENLFAPASADLLESGLGLLAGVADSLMALPAGYRFRIAGHADATPVGGSLQERYPSNWELSAARAAAVVRHLSESYELSDDRFEVVSFGTTQPVATNATAAGRSQNRRIEIVVMPGVE